MPVCPAMGVVQNIPRLIVLAISLSICVSSGVTAVKEANIIAVPGTAVVGEQLLGSVHLTENCNLRIEGLRFIGNLDVKSVIDAASVTSEDLATAERLPFTSQHAAGTWTVDTISHDCTSPSRVILWCTSCTYLGSALTNMAVAGTPTQTGPAVVLMLTDADLSPFQSSLTAAGARPSRSLVQAGCGDVTVAGKQYTFDYCVSLTDTLGLRIPYSIAYSLEPSPSGGTTIRGAMQAIPVEGWVGWGFPTPPARGMIGSKAIIVSPNSESSTGAIVDGYVLEDYTPEAVNAAKGQFPLTETAAERRSDGTLVAVFTAELPDAFDTLTTTPRNIIYACGTIASGDKLDSHLVANQAVHPYGQAQLQFRAASANGSSDSSSGVQATSSQEDTSYMWAHAWLMGLGWGLFIPLGAVIAHGFKEYDPAWFQIHRALQSLGLIMGFIGLGLIFKFADDKYAGNPEYSTWNIQYPKHRNIGISVMALGLAQATALVFRPHKGTKLRTIWHAWHALVGLAAISLAIANVYIGMYQVKVANTANWARVLYSVALGLIAALGLGREGFRLLRRKKAKEGVDGGKEEKGVYAEAVVGTPKA